MPSTFSGSSTLRTIRTVPQSVNTLVQLRTKFSGIAESHFAVEQFVSTLQLQTYDRMTLEERQEHLDKFDALDLFTAVQEINRELATVKLENHFLNNFLEKNDPKLLIGLKQKRDQVSAQQQHRLSATSQQSSPHTLRRDSSRRSVMTTTQSIYTQASAKKSATDYHLNYRAKIDMVSKTASEVETRLHEIESKAMTTIKVLNARIEELRYRYNETEETGKNFELHFLRDERDMQFLEKATEKQIERKFRKFVNNWFKNARSLLSTMRLRITALQENCQQLRSDLITKSDMSGILGAVDFEQLIIKRTELLNALDDKNAHMAGLKGVTGKASLAMSEEKQLMMSIEDESKRITNKTIEITRVIAKLEKEAQFVEEGNRKDLKTLKNLKDQLERYEAPSVLQYIEKKDEMLALEKEEKMLQRKIYILNMKLNNIVKKHKYKDTDQ